MHNAILKSAQLVMEQVLNELKAVAEAPVPPDDEFHTHVADAQTAIEEAIARLDEHLG